MRWRDEKKFIALFFLASFTSFFIIPAKIMAFQDPSCSTDCVWQIDGTVLRCLMDTADIHRVVVPEGITVISKAAFNPEAFANSRYDQIREIVLPDSIKRVEEYAFRGCTALKSINLPDGMTVILRGLFYGCTSLENIVIPDSVRVIEEEAFYGCSSLKDITFPNGLLDIKDSAFEYCESITEVVLPEGLRSVGRYAFSYCSNLISFSCDPDTDVGIGILDYSGIRLDGGFTIAGTTLLKYNGQETSVAVPDTIKRIDSGAFYGCNNMQEVSIPDSVIEIGDQAFYKCEKLTTVYQSAMLERTGYDIFSGTPYEQYEDGLFIKDGILWRAESDAETIEDPKGVIKIAGYAFYGVPAVRIVLPDSTEQIGQFAFGQCENLRSVNLPESVKSVDAAAFAGCVSLETIALPDNLISVEPLMFYNCRSLSTITFPKELEIIGIQAF